MTFAGLKFKFYNQAIKNPEKPKLSVNFGRC